MTSTSPHCFISVNATFCRFDKAVLARDDHTVMETDPSASPLTRSKRPWYKPTVVEVLVLIGIVALIVSIAIPSLQRLRQTAGRQPCPSNLSHIGRAILLYSIDYGGICPPDLETLKTAEDLTDEILHCPTTDGRPAYLYAAAGLKLNDLDDRDVLCFEPLSNHDGDGMNILFGDGHVEFQMNGRESPNASIHQQFNAGTRPVRLPEYKATTTMPQ
jgi:prepilin-type processing-associated H-X9-DG protein